MCVCLCARATVPHVFTLRIGRQRQVSRPQAGRGEQESGPTCLRLHTYIIQISQLTSPEKPNQPLIERENEIPLPRGETNDLIALCCVFSPLACIILIEAKLAVALCSGPEGAGSLARIHVML